MFRKPATKSTSSNFSKSDVGAPGQNSWGQSSVSLRTADAFPVVASLPPKATTGNASAVRRLVDCTFFSFLTRFGRVRSISKLGLRGGGTKLKNLEFQG